MNITPRIRTRFRSRIRNRTRSRSSAYEPLHRFMSHIYYTLKKVQQFKYMNCVRAYNITAMKLEPRQVGHRR